METDAERLVSLFERLSQQDRYTLLSFAGYLAENKSVIATPAVAVSGAAPVEPESVPEPVPIPRPDEERVVAAIKRLSETYPMLNKNDMLGVTSDLLTQHVVQGRDAIEIIDELERVFLEHYQALVESR